MARSLPQPAGSTLESRLSTACLQLSRADATDGDESGDETMGKRTANSVGEAQARKN